MVRGERDQRADPGCWSTLRAWSRSLLSQAGNLTAGLHVLRVFGDTRHGRILMLAVKTGLAALAAGGALALSSVLLTAPAYGATPKDCAAAVAVQTKVSADATRLDTTRDAAKRKADTVNDTLAAARAKQAKAAETLSATQAQLEQDTKAVNDAIAALIAAQATPGTADDVTAAETLEAARAKFNADKPKVDDAKTALATANTAVATAQADADAANKAYQEARREADAADAALAEANAAVNQLCGGTSGNNTPRLTCTDYAAKGVFDIRRGTDNRYRGYLDPDHDGIACERNGEGDPPAVVVPGPQGPQGPQGPAGPSGSVSGGSSTVVPSAPTGEAFSQIGQAPAGAAATGFGPNA